RPTRTTSCSTSRDHGGAASTIGGPTDSAPTSAAKQVSARARTTSTTACGSISPGASLPERTSANTTARTLSTATRRVSDLPAVPTLESTSSSGAAVPGRELDVCALPAITYSAAATIPSIDNDPTASDSPIPRGVLSYESQDPKCIGLAKRKLTSCTQDRHRISTPVEEADNGIRVGKR